MLEDFVEKVCAAAVANSHDRRQEGVSQCTENRKTRLHYHHLSSIGVGFHGCGSKLEAWLVTGAIYGLTQSPHDWGMHRDGMFRQFRWVCQGETLKLIETPERHLWRIISESTQEEKGYLCSYVDDLLVIGEKAVVDSTIQKIESTWSCSEPDYINDSKNVRFCGYELRWDKEGNLLLMQPSYVLDLLQKYDVKGQEAEPCPKIIFEEKEEYLAETLREAQQITGELLWVQTRTRPDLSYVV